MADQVDGARPGKAKEETVGVNEVGVIELPTTLGEGDGLELRVLIGAR